MAQVNTDSLLLVLQTAKEDTNKVNLFVKLSDVYFNTDLERSKAYGLQALELSEKQQYNLGILRGNNLTGRCYAVQGVFSKALEYFQSALLMARKMKSPMREAIMLSSISAVYTGNDDFEKALQYALEAKSVNERAGVKYMVSLMINIGMLYANQLKFDDALKALQEGMRQEKAYGSEESLGELATLYINFGGTYIRMPDYVPALENYFEGAKIAAQIGHDKNYALSVANIGAIYMFIAQGKSKKPLPDSLQNKNVCLQKAEHYITEAMRYAEKLDLQEMKQEVYYNLSSVNEMKGDYKKAFTYMAMHAHVSDSFDNMYKQKEFARIEAQFFVRAQTDSLNYLNALKDKEIKQSKLERNGGILLIALAGIISLLLINRQKLKHIQKRKTAEAEKQRAEELARQQLADFTKSIQEKNELIEQFGTEIAKYQALPCSNELPEKDNSLQLLQQSVILNDAQWSDFQSLFNKVHTGYIGRVKQKLPELTTAELRTILLTKLGLTNKEMAAMLGVSLEAVRVNKHRLLKKIQLPEDSQLEDFVHSI